MRRPKTRGDCEFIPRPCPFVGCKYNLYLDVNPNTGRLKINSAKPPWVMRESCALDIADRGEVTLEYVGGLINLTRERIRQIERQALRKLRHPSRSAKLKQYINSKGV